MNGAAMPGDENGRVAQIEKHAALGGGGRPRAAAVARGEIVGDGGAQGGHRRGVGGGGGNQFEAHGRGLRPVETRDSV
jgi:hypothetical protein